MRSKEAAEMYQNSQNQNQTQEKNDNITETSQTHVYEQNNHRDSDKESFGAMDKLFNVEQEINGAAEKDIELLDTEIQSNNPLYWQPRNGQNGPYLENSQIGQQIKIDNQVKIYKKVDRSIAA